MKKLIGSRGSGKTTEAIRLSASTGSPILVLTRLQAKNIEERAESLELKIPKPLGLMDLNNELYGGEVREKGLIVDEALDVLRGLLSFDGLWVTAVTVSPEDD